MAAPSSSHETELDNVMQKFMQTNNVRNAQIAVGQAGSITTQRAYTWTEPGLHVTSNDDVFLLASVSKAFCSAAIYKLFPTAQQRVDTLAYEFLGYSGSPSDNRISEINIQQLIDHRAGFDDRSEDGSSPRSPDWTYNARKVAQFLGHNVTSAKDLVEFVFTQRLDYAPGQEYVYSNTGYVILSRIVEKASGLSYFDYLTQNVVEPLGMNVQHFKTQQHYDAVVPEAFETGLPSYDYTDTTTMVPDVLGGDGMVKEACDGSCSLACSAGDLVKLAGRYAVWGIGEHTSTYDRMGSTPGVSTYVCSRGDGRDLAVVINTRESRPGVNIDFTDENCLFNLDSSPVHEVLNKYP